MLTYCNAVNASAKCIGGSDDCYTYACTYNTPVMHYHNVLQFIINACTFIFNPRRYYWKGWCVKDELKDE